MARVEMPEKKVEKVEAELVDKPRGEKVIKGSVHRKKKTVGTKLAETFFNSDGESLRDYIFYDVAVPAIKTFLYDIVKNGMYEALWGGGRPPDDIRRDRGRSYTGYGSYYRSRDEVAPPWDKSSKQPPRRVRTSRNRYDFSDIFLDHREEAEQVLHQMTRFVDRYGEVTVGDFLDFIGETSESVDMKWGWTNLDRAYVGRAHKGWAIFLPEVEQLE